MWTFETCVLFTLSILLVEGFPAQTDKKPISNDENCLKISPEIQKQLDGIVEEITKNINSISANYDDIDMRLLEISIDRHSAEESDKNTVVQISVNDCANNNEKLKSDNLGDKSDVINDSKGEELSVTDKSYVLNDKLSNDNDDEISKTVNGGLIVKLNDDIDSKDDKNVILDNIPDVLKFINYDYIKNELFNDCAKNINESLALNDNDKVFFEAMAKVRGTGPFVVYQRRYGSSEQYWFL